jgi:hypothetical protein
MELALENNAIRTQSGRLQIIEKKKFQGIHKMRYNVPMPEINSAQAHIWQSRPTAKTSPRKMDPAQFLEAYDMYNRQRNMTIPQILDLMREKYGDTVSLRRFHELKKAHEDCIRNGGVGITIDMGRLRSPKSKKGD